MNSWRLNSRATFQQTPSSEARGIERRSVHFKNWKFLIRNVSRTRNTSLKIKNFHKRENNVSDSLKGNFFFHLKNGPALNWIEIICPKFFDRTATQRKKIVPEKKRSWKENWNGEINYSWCTITKKKFLVFSLSFFSWSFVSSFLSGSSQMAAAHLIGRMRLKANNLFFCCCFFRSFRCSLW